MLEEAVLVEVGSEVAPGWTEPGKGSSERGGDARSGKGFPGNRAYGWGDRGHAVREPQSWSHPSSVLAARRMGAVMPVAVVTERSGKVVLHVPLAGQQARHEVVE